MEIALNEAEIARQNGDVPVGVVITHNGEIIAKSHNQIVELNDVLAHSEIIAIKEASSKINQIHLSECDMYVTLEPCPMCAGAIVLARIKRVYIGTEDLKTGAGGSVYNILQDRKLNHYCEVYNGISQIQCSKILSDFFSELRDGKRKIKYDF
jgi:tRNA(adenine34) deaminase